MTQREHDGRDGKQPLILRIGREEVVVRRRYEALSIVNDLLVGVWFAIGSILFFSAATTRAGTWLFLVGSVQLLIRPAIRLTRNLHLQRVGEAARGGFAGSGQDF
jgi:hypothetical protein